MNLLPPNDFGKVLVEECERVDMKKFLNDAKLKLKRVLIQSEIAASGYAIELDETKVNFGGTRFWFKCPLCKTRRAVLYKNPISEKIGCRKCLRLDYRARRYKGMLETSFLSH